MVTTFKQHLRKRLDACFAPREVIIRCNGRVSYLRLSSRSQMLGASILAGLSSMALATSLTLATNQIAVHGQDLAMRQSDQAYTGLLAEVDTYFHQFRDSASGDMAGPVRPFDADAASQPGDMQMSLSAMRIAAPNVADEREDSEGDARRALRVSLQQKLRSFDSDLQRIAARNQSLQEQVVSLSETVSGLRHSNEGLQKDNVDLTKRLASRALENGALTAELKAARAQLASAQTQHDNDLAQLSSLDGQIAALQANVDNASQDKADLAQQVEQNERALATLVAQRAALQSTRADLSQSISGLKERLSSLQENQAEFVASLAERTRSNMAEMEKTVEMTGLNIDKLLLKADDSHSGQGGPFIPAPTSSANDENEQKLMMSVATLDGEVGRWEKLQVILRSLPLTAPVDHYYISSSFGERVDPINGEKAIHEGVDMVGALRSEVLATAPGTVVFAGWQTGYGQVVEIDHGFGVHTFYAHLDQLAVKKGQTVDYRDILGLLGTTGRSSGPHVHYEVRYDNKPLDPMGFLKAGRYVFKG
ncbi:MAG TPA: peptidoglycan DD-metalloendopeptidase family protein [Dongiaceae bacterium]|nr:peptidoglycan DD-metalloendopeptidase family protein [Dongiaceae bacterium]